MAPNSRPRKLAFAALLTTVMLTVTGCMRLDLTIDLHENNRASGQMDMAFQDEAITAMGYDPDEFFAEAEGAMGENLPAGATMDRYPVAGWTGTRTTIADADISDLSTFEAAGFSGLTVTRDGDYYVFHTTSGLADEMEGMAEEVPAGMEPVSTTLTLTCPGEVTESNGAVTGNRVVWNLMDFTSEQPLTARCGAVAAGGILGGSYGHSNTGFARWWPALLAGVLILGLLAALAHFLRKRSHVERDTVPSNFEQTAQWQTPQPEATEWQTPQPQATETHTYIAPRSELDDADWIVEDGDNR